MGGLPQDGPRRRASLSVMGTLALAAVATTWSCAGDAADEGSWGGTIETLAGGGIRVVSPDKGLWSEGTVWRLEEDLRIGSFQSEGPVRIASTSALRERRSRFASGSSRTTSRGRP